MPAGIFAGEHHRIVAGAARHAMRRSTRPARGRDRASPRSAGSMATDGWSRRGSHVIFTPRRVAISLGRLRQSLRSRLRACDRPDAARRATQPRGPGTTLPAPGSTAILPTVATSPDVASASRSTSVIHAAAHASASFRIFIGVVPACPATPSNVKSARLWPEMTSTTASGRLRFSRTGPCSMWNSRYPSALAGAFASGMRFGIEAEMPDGVAQRAARLVACDRAAPCRTCRPARGCRETERRTARLPRRKIRRPRSQMETACSPSSSTSAMASTMPSTPSNAPALGTVSRCEPM